MATAILIAESLQDDAELGGYWHLTRIERIPVTNLSENSAQPVCRQLGRDCTSSRLMMPMPKRSRTLSLTTG